MKIKLCFLFLNIMVFTVFAQDVKTAGDRFFFGYNYTQAIQEYEKGRTQEILTNQQYLNLAESYFNTANYPMAWEVYRLVLDSESIITPYHFNKMLRSLAENEGVAAMNHFLKNDSILLESSWLENAKFNFDILNKKDAALLDYHVFNLEENSSEADFSPSFYQDKLLFTSGRSDGKRKKDKNLKNPYLNIVVGKVDLTGQVLNVNSFTGIPKGEFHEATPHYSAELDKIFYVLSNEKDGEMLFDATGKNALSIGRVDPDGKFNFILKNLSTSFYYPYYDSKSQRLYFAANFEDSYGGTDIYYVSTNQGQIMSAPINMGPQINTPGNEIAPYIFEGGLYFSSDVFYGHGGMDIYKSNLRDDRSAGVPINLGPGINSTADDFGFIVRNDGKTGLEGYFSSNREGGKGKDDIYGFKLAEKPKLNTIVLEGRTINPNTGVVIGGVNIKVFGEENKILKELESSENGSYTIEVPWQEKITLIANKEKYALYKTYFIAADLKDAKDTNLYLDFVDDFVVEREDKKVLNLGKFVFRTKSSLLTPEIKTELDKAVAIIKKFPEFNLKIESHTDSKGGSSSNFKVSQGRADAIKAYLIDKGVPSKNILYAIGYGEDHILNQCVNGAYCIDYFHSVNRRILLVVLNYEALY
ncbi:OmpA family protein [Cellulophaga sp. F20128]|uniref:OmpA family protein n=1 Tax=Cellulophaga sp. F20128 TaxID=2926413 RepID=UPI001FF0DFF1|nr:OmpA family protein [Cellulophaga sp. F20128]MCK0158851.1 OmpA family protein [Cellulophaga sp. F20128]